MDPSDTNLFGQLKPLSLPKVSDSETVPVSQSAQVCPTCKKVFSNKKSLYKHIRNKGNMCYKKGDRDESVKCEICRTVFSQPKALKKHRERNSCNKKQFSRVKVSKSEVIHKDMVDDATSEAVEEVLQLPAKNMIRMHLNPAQIMRELEKEQQQEQEQCISISKNRDLQDRHLVDMMDTVTSLLSDPMRLTMVPSTVVRKDSQLVGRDMVDTVTSLVSDPMRLTKVPSTVVRKDSQLVDRDMVDTVTSLVSDQVRLSDLDTSSRCGLVDRDRVEESDLVDSDTVTSLVSDPMRLTMVPGTVVKDNQLVVTQPRKSRWGLVDSEGDRDWVEDSDLVEINHPDTVNSLVSDPGRLTMVPSTVVRKDSQLVDRDMVDRDMVDRDMVDMEVDHHRLTMVSSTVVRKDTQLVVTQPRKILTSCDAGYSSSDLDLVTREVEDMEVEDLEGESHELPESYKLLLQFFQACETAVQMLNNRNEVITYLKIKRAIESITKRNFDIKNLKQIQTVFQEITPSLGRELLAGLARK